MADWLLGPAPARLVALHGFTQRGAMFRDVAHLLDVGVWAPDLPGHGASPAVANWDEAVAQVGQALSTVGRLPLLGYSQGGRLALGLASSRPDLVAHLVLVSTSPGIEDVDEREARRARDLRLADHIERVGTERFVAEWVSLAMFEGVQQLEHEWKERDLELRRTNDAGGLAAALRSYGTGSMPYLGHSLRTIECPVTVIVGADDEKYRELAFDMARIAGADLRVIGGAGHAIVAEAPLQLADVIREII